MTAEIHDISLEIDNPGESVRDYFTGSEWLADGDTFLERINASFATTELAIDWLTKSYKGRDADGNGVMVDWKSFGHWQEGFGQDRDSYTDDQDRDSYTVGAQ